jgi:hypothetical protein
MLRRTSRQRPAICVVWNPDLVMDTWAYNLVTGAKIQLSLLHVYRRFGRLSWSELRAFQKTVAVAHGWATEEWRDERSALDATSAEFGLLPVGGKRLSAARASLITELPRPILNAVKEDALEYEGERGGLQELCNDSAIRAWNYAEQE